MSKIQRNLSLGTDAAPMNRVPTRPGMPWKTTLILEMSWNSKVSWNKVCGDPE